MTAIMMYESAYVVNQIEKQSKIILYFCRDVIKQHWQIILDNNEVRLFRLKYQTSSKQDMDN